ncbi:DEAD/DEAH box helicase family protein [Haloplanus salinus]|uniref:DEAD/DEAH box helicase family protein n=1 Tax=Haloplanus salinus TaxID=1126245 RepID=UPI0011C07E0E|nr:hypothetical protein [Haloplanus salinus]
MENEHNYSINTPETTCELPLSAEEMQILSESKQGTPITTETAEIRLQQAITDALRNSENSLLAAPTGLGKTHIVATTPWRDFPEITGNQPVIHISQTIDAREDAVRMSEEAGVKYTVLKGRDEVCSVARGDYDRQLHRIDRLTASEWLKKKCDRENISFAEAHDYLSRQFGGLPCGRGRQCSSKTQWQNVPRKDKQPEYDIIHATATFAKLGQLTAGTNVIFDERPDYAVPVRQNKLRKAVTGFLHNRTSNAKEYDWEDLIKLTQRVNPQSGVLDDLTEGWFDKLETYGKLFEEDVSKREKFKSMGATNALVPAIGRAMVSAYPVGNGRYRGQSDLLTIVFDAKNNVRVIHERPDLSKTRCVIGLDAHPSERLWQFHTGIEFQPGELLTPEERQYWRTVERGLYVVQIGSNTNPLTSGWRTSKQETEVKAIIDALHEKAGEAFGTAICPKEIKRDVEQIMRNAGIEEPQLMHYGEEKSRNEFGEERVGLLLGCIDPGDHAILNNLALLDLFAEPETVVDEDGNVVVDEDGKELRAYGRGFIGEDADAANEFLESVREMHIAQSIGRYARNARDTNLGAIVYVWTDAIPEDMVDHRISGVRLYRGKKRDAIANYVYETDEPVTKKEVVTALRDDLDGLTDKYVWQVLSQMADQGVVSRSKGTGPYGADEYEYRAGKLEPSIDLTIRAL